MSTLKITVVIPAYRRREFILQAVDSVLKNEIKSKLQIIVVKNFHDSTVEQQLKERDVNVIDSMDDTLGGKVAEAFQESEGDVISILEDDDKFSSNKLMEIEKVFQDKKVGFFHNAISFIDVNGKVIKSPSVGKEILEVPNKTKEENLRMIHQYKGYHNTSSMTLRSDLAKALLPYLAKVKLNVDLLLFFGALKSDYDMVFTPMKLTQYRKHDSISNKKNFSFTDFLSNNSAFMNTLFDDSFIYRDMMKNSSFYKYTMAWIEFINKSKTLFSSTSDSELVNSDNTIYDWVPFGKGKNRMINLTLKNSLFVRKIILRSLYIIGYSVST